LCSVGVISRSNQSSGDPFGLVAYHVWSESSNQNKM